MQLQLYNCIIHNTKYTIANVIILQSNYIFLFSFLPLNPSMLLSPLFFKLIISFSLIVIACKYLRKYCAHTHNIHIYSYL